MALHILVIGDIIVAVVGTTRVEWQGYAGLFPCFIDLVCLGEVNRSKSWGGGVVLVNCGQKPSLLDCEVLV